MVENAEHPNMERPWCTIGKVFTGRDSNFNVPIWTGSGVMVGKNLLLTASHVVP